MEIINAAISELEAFLAVAELRSFREAGERLSISQPAVSNRLRRLENKLGMRLLDRTTRRMELTDAGVRFKEKASAAVKGVSNLVEEFRDEASMKHGRVKLVVSASLAAVVLPAVLVEYQRRYPQIRVELRETFESVVEALDVSDVDFALVSEAIDRPGIRFEHLYTEEFVLLTPRGHPIERLSQIEIKDIAQYPLLLLAHSAIGAAVADLLEARGFTANVVVESVNLLTLLALAEAGAGLIVLPRLLLARVNLNLVSALQIRDGPPPRRFGLAFRRGRSLSPAARALVRLIQRNTLLAQ